MTGALPQAQLEAQLHGPAAREPSTQRCSKRLRQSHTSSAFRPLLSQNPSKSSSSPWKARLKVTASPDHGGGSSRNGPGAALPEGLSAAEKMRETSPAPFPHRPRPPAAPWHRTSALPSPGPVGTGPSPGARPHREPDALPVVCGAATGPQAGAG